MDSHHLKQQGTDENAICSPSNEEVKNDNRRATNPISWSSDRLLPTSPIFTTNSFDGYTSPFPFGDTRGPFAQAPTNTSNSFEGHLENHSRHPFEAMMDPPSHLGTSPFPHQYADIHAMEDASMDVQPCVSHMIYCFDPYSIPSNWNHPMHKDSSLAEQKPSPCHFFDSTLATSPNQGTPLPLELSSNSNTSQVALLSQPDGKKSPNKRKRESEETEEAQGEYAVHAFQNPQEQEQPMTSRGRRALLSWYDRYNDLVDYKNTFGHTNVPQQYQKNHALGIWVNKQRMEMKIRQEGRKSSMTDRKMNLLKNICFEWAKPKGLTAWNLKFHELAKFKAKEGHCHVPTKHKKNRPLGRWVSTQRTMYKSYKNGEKAKSLSVEEVHRRIALLESIDFAWSMLNTSSPSASDESAELLS